MISCWVSWSRRNDQIWKKRSNDWSWKEPPIKRNCLKLNKRSSKSCHLTRTSSWTVKLSTFWPPQRSSQHKSRKNSKSPPSLKNLSMPPVRNTNQYLSKPLVCSSPSQTSATSTLCTSTHLLITLSSLPSRFWRVISRPIFQLDSKTSKLIFCTRCIRTFVVRCSKKTNCCFPSCLPPDSPNSRVKSRLNSLDSCWQAVWHLMTFCLKNPKIVTGSAPKIGAKSTDSL